MYRLPLNPALLHAYTNSSTELIQFDFNVNDENNLWSWVNVYATA